MNSSQHQRRDAGSFAEIPTEWKRIYLKRTEVELARDMVNACDQIRQQRKEIDRLTAQLFISQMKKVALAAIVGGASAELIKFGATLLFNHFFPHAF